MQPTINSNDYNLFLERNFELVGIIESGGYSINIVKSNKDRPSLRIGERKIFNSGNFYAHVMRKSGRLWKAVPIDEETIKNEFLLTCWAADWVGRNVRKKK